MAKQNDQKINEMSSKERKAAERAERLRKQLRGNLQKRKAQTKARSTPEATKDT